MNIRNFGAGIAVPLALSGATLLASAAPANATTPPAKVHTTTSPEAAKPGDDVHCLAPSMCYENEVYTGDGADQVEAQCAKIAASDATLAGLGTAVTSTPVDFPGVISVTTITFLGRGLFCLAGWR